MNALAPLDWFILVAYLLLTLSFALFASRRVQTLRDFSTASRGLPSGAILATMAASFIGGGYSLGVTARGYEVGLTYLAVFLAFSVKTVLEGVWVAPRLQQYENAATVGDVMGYHYGKLVRLLTGVLSLLFCAGIVGVVSRAAGIMLETLAGIPLPVGAIACAVVVVLYSALGGMWSSVVSDCLQFLILGIAIPLLPLLFVVGAVPADIADLASQSLAAAAFEPIPFWILLGAILGFFFGEALVPPYAQRAFSAVDSKAVSRGFVLAGLYSVPWFFLLVALGVMLRPILPGRVPDAVLVEAIQTFLPVGVVGLATAALLAIVMSTQDSFLNSAATAFVHDIYRYVGKGKGSAGSLLAVARGSTVVIGVMGVGFALVVPGLIDALLYLYTLWAPTVILPLVFAVLGLRVTPVAGLAGILAGGATTGLWSLFAAESAVPAIIPGLVANQIAFWAFNARGPLAAGAWLDPVVDRAISQVTLPEHRTAGARSVQGGA